MSYPTNNVHILGHLGQDPKIKTTTKGKKSATFNVAAKEAYINAEGKRIESTEWINVIAWDGLAVICEKYLHKGKQVAVCGKIKTSEYTDAKGERKWLTQVVAIDILLLGGTSRVESEATA